MIFEFKKGTWELTISSRSLSFVCWNCNKNVASEKKYYANDFNGYEHSSIYICPNCNAPVIIDDTGKFILRSLPGKEIKKLPENILQVYEEVRRCMQSDSSTAAVMLMRKIIMNVAVHEGADKNEKFAYYVMFLCAHGIVPRKSRKKAESVKNLGNDANHEIENRTREEAQNCFEFIELLLKANYEFADDD